MSRRLKAAFARVYATDNTRPKNVSTFESDDCAARLGVLERPSPRMVRHLGGEGLVGWDLVDLGHATFGRGGLDLVRESTPRHSSAGSDVDPYKRHGPRAVSKTV